MSKTMKKLSCILLAMVLVVGLAACGSKKDSSSEQKEATEEVDKEAKKEEEKPKPYVKGSVEGNHFESEWLNMQADFSDEYVMATEEEIAEMQSAGSEVLMNEEGQEAIEKTEEAGTVTNEMMVLALDGIPNCTVAVEKLALENITAKQYLTKTRDELIANMTEEFPIAFRGTLPAVMIAGEEFLCLRADMTVNGVLMSSDSYVRIKDSYAILINATYNKDTEDKKDELLSVFQPMEASEK